MFQKKTLIVGSIVVVLGLAFGTFFIRSNHNQDTRKVKASSDTAILTTEADWNSGSLSNISESSGLISIDQKGAVAFSDRANYYQAYQYNISSYNYSITASSDSGKEQPLNNNAVDASPSIYWDTGLKRKSSPVGSSAYWQIDLGQQVNAGYLVMGVMFSGLDYGSGYQYKYYASNNGQDWTELVGNCIDAELEYLTHSLYGVCGMINVSNSYRYYKTVISKTEDYSPVFDSFDDTELKLFDFYLYKPATGRSAIHTTAPTQIDGGANFWHWDSFTPTQTVPANTSVTYRYRSSTNGSDHPGAGSTTCPSGCKSDS